MSSRRQFLGLSCLTLAMGDLAAVECQSTLLSDAVAKAGGDRLLRAVKKLRWRGTATIFAGGRTVEIGASTEVVPFVSARSETWLLADGPSKSRTLVIDGDQGWVERGGQRSELAEPMRVHERQQFSIYGLMLLVEACALRAVTPQNRLLQGLAGVEVDRPPAPRTILYFDKSDRLAAATNRVGDPEAVTKPPIEQRFMFDGEIADRGVRWPQSIVILQREAKYFELRLSEFVAER